MAEYADMILDGTMCQCCGEFLNEDPPGYPVYCAECQPEVRPSVMAGRPMVACPHCTKKVTRSGLPQHIAAKHPEKV